MKNPCIKINKMAPEICKTLLLVYARKLNKVNAVPLTKCLLKSPLVKTQSLKVNTIISDRNNKKNGNLCLIKYSSNLLYRSFGIYNKDAIIYIIIGHKRIRMSSL